MPVSGGFIYSEPHKEDFHVCMAMDDATDIFIPDNYAVSFLPPIENQKSTNNCVAQTIACILEVMYFNKTKKHTDFSVGFIYGNRDPGDYDGYGMTGYQACDHIIKDGDVFKQLFDSNSEVPDIISTVLKVKDSLLKYAIVPSMYIKENSINSIKKFIMKYDIPVMGMVKMKDIYLDDDVSGYHAMPLYGWENQNLAVFQNSWGADTKYKFPKIEFDKIVEYWMIVPWEDLEFKDLDKNHWAYMNIISCATDKLIRGYPDNTFRPDNNMTRAEFCAMIYRMMKLKFIK